MAEYIEREKAKEFLACDYAYAAADLLDRVPTADVAEVKHGRKIVRKRHRGFHSINCPLCNGTFRSNEPYSEDVEYCSECGKKLDDTFQNYCPNCGAKIDGERKAENGN